MTGAVVSAELIAQAAVANLPISHPLEIGTPTTEQVSFDGVAVVARFTGTRSGEVLLAVERDLVQALQQSPLGALDLGAALAPALAAVASATGTAATGPGTVLEPDPAMAGLLSKPNAVLVPLLHEGNVRALVGIAVAPDEAPEFVSPHYPSPEELRAAATPAAVGRAGNRRGLDLLRDVSMDVTAQIGSTRMTISELLRLSEGAVVELDRAAGAPADLLVNGHLIARGEVVVIDENFALRITEIISDDANPLTP
ncbi:MAG TPA: flagellar motor switch protein FliN [Jatrophihabitans sp.]|nr:flagellar motor switch protein FliN [Jatrophihabitans sp.]